MWPLKAGAASHRRSTKYGGSPQHYRKDRNLKRPGGRTDGWPSPPLAPPLPMTMSVVVLTAWPSTFSATARYSPPSSGATQGRMSEHTPRTSVLCTVGSPTRLWPFLNQVTLGRGQPRTAQLMQHRLPRGRRWARSPTRNLGFWPRSDSRKLSAFTVNLSGEGESAEGTGEAAVVSVGRRPPVPGRYLCTSLDI